MFERNTKKVTVPTVTTKRVSVPPLHGPKKLVAPTVAGAAAKSAHSVEEAKSWTQAKTHDLAHEARDLAQDARGAAAPARPGKAGDKPFRHKAKKRAGPPKTPRERKGGRRR